MGQISGCRKKRGNNGDLFYKPDQSPGRGSAVFKRWPWFWPEVSGAGISWEPLPSTSEAPAAVCQSHPGLPFPFLGRWLCRWERFAFPLTTDKRAHQKCRRRSGGENAPAKAFSCLLHVSTWSFIDRFVDFCLLKNCMSGTQNLLILDSQDNFMIHLCVN